VGGDQNETLGPRARKSLNLQRRILQNLPQNFGKRGKKAHGNVSRWGNGRGPGVGYVVGFCLIKIVGLAKKSLGTT